MFLRGSVRTIDVLQERILQKTAVAPRSRSSFQRCVVPRRVSSFLPLLRVSSVTPTAPLSSPPPPPRTGSSRCSDLPPLQAAPLQEPTDVAENNGTSFAAVSASMLTTPSRTARNTRLSPLVQLLFKCALYIDVKRQVKTCRP